MKLDKSLERLLKRYGLLDILEELTKICLTRANGFGKAGKKERLQPFQLPGVGVYEISTEWHRNARKLRKVIGEIRHDEPDAEPVGRD